MATNSGIRTEQTGGKERIERDSSNLGVSISVDTNDGDYDYYY